MASHGAPRRYDSLAIAFHWASATAILVALPLGFLAANAADDRHAAALLRIHVPLGVLILILTVARMLWRLRHAPPPAPAGQPRWQAAAARVSHILLYAVPIVLGASGIGLMILSGAAPQIFSDVQATLPDFRRFPPMAVHAVGAFALVGLIGLHAAAAAYHQFVRRDRLLARMGIGAGSDAPRGGEVAGLPPRLQIIDP